MEKPIHIAVTRPVKPGCEEEFEKTVLDFFAQTLSQKGSLGAQLLKPLPGSKDQTYGILRSFASKEACDHFYKSEEYLQEFSDIHTRTQTDVFLPVQRFDAVFSIVS